MPGTKMMPMKSQYGATNQQLGLKYENLGLIGCGSYGEVYKIRHRITKKFYAMKKYKKIFTNRVLALRTLRQITILRRINHERIIKIYDILPPVDINNFDSIGVVLQYLPFDLKKLCSKNKFLTDHHVNKIIYQLLIALRYLKSIKILHRDLKPQNILSDDDYNIKICDFGLARGNQPSFSQMTKLQDKNKVQNNVQMTCHVVSRWYRAPQLILMQTKYDVSIQMWSVGCILGELIAQHQKNKKISMNKHRKALFQGKACFPLSPPKQDCAKLYKVHNGFPYSQDDQISKILQIIGSPTQQQVSFIEQEIAANYIRSLPKYQKTKASHIFNYCKPQWQDFLQRTLVFDPRKRMNINEALNHEMFNDIQKQEDFHFLSEQQNYDLLLPSDLSMKQINQRLKQQIISYCDNSSMDEQK